MNSVSGYTPRIPTLIGAWVKTERKRNAAHGDSHFQTESELRAEGERAIDAHDAEVAARAWDEGVEAGVQASAEWWRGYEGPMTETNPYMKEAFDETDI